MRAAILSDIHSNYNALELVIRDARVNGVDEFWCLGDIVDYGWQPIEVIAELQRIMKLDNWIMGNHDAFFAGMLRASLFGKESQIMMNHNKTLIVREASSLPGFEEYVKRLFVAEHRTVKQKRFDGLVCYLTHSGFDWQDYPYFWFDERPLGKHALKLFNDVRDNHIQVGG